MSRPFWSEDNDAALADFLFESNLSTLEIAKTMGVSTEFIKSRIRDLNLTWVRRSKGNVSRGQGSLTSILRKLLPGEEIKVEEPLGDRLFLDIYCPKYQLGIEYHGRQHFEFVEFFHHDAQGFQDSIERDERKIQKCKDLGIVLVSFRYNDDLSEDVIYSRILDAIRNAPVAIPGETKKRSLKDNAWYQQSRQRQRDANRAAYREAKRKRLSPRI